MNFKEKFDSIITYIEKNIKNDKKSIMEGILKKYPYISPAGINSVFEFITGLRLGEYIIRRRLIKILQYKNERKCSLEYAVDEFLYSSATNYMRDFKETFGTTVKNISNELYNRELTPKYIDALLTTNVDKIPKTVELSMEPKIFNMPKSSFERLKRIIELTDFYDEDQEVGEIAYSISEKLDFEIDDIFDFSISYYDNRDWLNKKHNKVDVCDLATVCMKLDCSIRESTYITEDILENSDFCGGDFSEIPDEFWKLYNDEAIFVEFNPSALLENYLELKERNYSYYDIVDILNCFSDVSDIEEAIELYDPDIDMDDIHLQFEREQKSLLEADELSTYTDDFLAISHNPDDFFDECDNEDDE